MILALDQGTTSSRAILFNHDGRLHAVAQQEFKQLFPQSGWVEHDAAEIWSSQLQVAQDVLRKGRVAAKDVKAIGITNQRETTAIWDRKTGKPIHHAIVWQDRRTASFCEELKRSGKSELIAGKTGLVIDAYFSASKIRWLLHNVPGALERAKRKELAFGTVDSWLFWNLTGGQLHITDASQCVAYDALQSEQRRMGRGTARFISDPGSAHAGGSALQRPLWQHRQRTLRRRNSYRGRRW